MLTWIKALFVFLGLIEEAVHAVKTQADSNRITAAQATAEKTGDTSTLEELARD